MHYCFFFTTTVLYFLSSCVTPTAWRHHGTAAVETRSLSEVGVWEPLPVPGTARIVRKGDTWWGLAREVGVTPRELARFNGRNIKDILTIGETVLLPPDALNVQQEKGAL